jgi:acyl-CoA thioesterase I
VIGRYGIGRRLYQLAVAMMLLSPAMAATAATSAPAAPRTILAFGDSLTAGYQLGPGQGFAPQLEAALRASGRNIRVFDAGVSGDTTAQGRARLNWVLGGLKTKGVARPDLVILELGANDMLRGQPPATARANLDAMIVAFRGQGSRLLLAGMLAAPNLGAGYARGFNTIYPDLAKRHGVPLYPFFMDGVAGVPRLQLGDGLHPNPAGVKVIVTRILPAVTRALDGR